MTNIHGHHIAECARCHQVMRIHGRQLCRTCHNTESRAGRLESWTTSRNTWSNARLIAAWKRLSALGYTTDRAAAELGLTGDGLRTAISKHRRRNPTPTPSTEWVTRSACAGSDPEWWFPHETAEATQSTWLRQQFCDHCPVITECLDDALRTGVVGVWAATTTKQRAAMKRRNTRQRTG